MIKDTYRALDKLGAFVLNTMAYVLGIAGVLMLFVFFPVGVGLLLAAILCALLSK